MPAVADYDADMPKNKALKEVLAESTRRVMADKKLSQPTVARLAKTHGHKIDQTTVGRIARAEIPTTVDTLDALAAGLGFEAWQLLVPELDPANPPKLGDGALPDDERELLQLYRAATGRWKIAIKYMAKLRADERQEQAVSYVLSMVSATPVPDAKLGENWTRPDRRRPPALLHEPEPDTHEPGSYSRRQGDRKKK